MASADVVRPRPKPPGWWQRKLDGVADRLLTWLRAWDAADPQRPDQLRPLAHEHPERVARDIREAWQELQARADNAGLAAGFTGTVTAFLSDSGPGAGLVGAVLGLTVGVLLLLMWARDARLALGPIGWVPTEEDLMAAFRTLRRKEAFTRLAWALSYPLLFGLGAVVIWAAAT